MSGGLKLVILLPLCHFEMWRNGVAGRRPEAAHKPAPLGFGRAAAPVDVTPEDVSPVEISHRSEAATN